MHVPWGFALPIYPWNRKWNRKYCFNIFLSIATFVSSTQAHAALIHSVKFVIMFHIVMSYNVIIANINKRNKQLFTLYLKSTSSKLTCNKESWQNKTLLFGGYNYLKISKANKWKNIIKSLWIIYAMLHILLYNYGPVEQPWGKGESNLHEWNSNCKHISWYMLYIPGQSVSGWGLPRPYSSLWGFSSRVILLSFTPLHWLHRETLRADGFSKVQITHTLKIFQGIHTNFKITQTNGTQQNKVIPYGPEHWDKSIL